MRRFWIVMLVVSMALAIALPARAEKPDKPDRPSTGFRPTACQVDRVSEVFTLNATELGGFNVTRSTLAPEADTRGLNVVLCVEVTLDGGTLRDLRVRWFGYDCQNCGLYRATGKDLRNFNSGEVFSAGVSVADWTDSMTVDVMPLTKSDEATLTVTIGLDKP